MRALFHLKKGTNPILEITVFCCSQVASCVRSYSSDFHWRIWCSCSLFPAPGLATLHDLQQAHSRNANTVCPACLSQFLHKQGERTAAARSKCCKLIVFNLRTFHSPSRRVHYGELFPLNSFRLQAFLNCLFFLFIL